MKLRPPCFASLFLIWAGVLAAANPLVYQAPPTELSDWTIEVSSLLSPQGNNAYGPGNLLGDPNTAWVEGIAGNGAGEWIRITQSGHLGNMKFQTVFVWNGYQKSVKSFQENGRVRELLVSWQGGEQQVRLADEMGMQSIRLRSPVISPWVKFQIQTAYTGDKFQDTALSGLCVDLEEFHYEPGGESIPTDSAPGKNIAGLLAGKWEGARHIVDYRPDGTFTLDPDGDQWVPLGTWKIEGNNLVTRWQDSGKVDRQTIVSIDSRSLVLRSDSGREYRLSRLQ